MHRNIVCDIFQTKNGKKCHSKCCKDCLLKRLLQNVFQKMLISDFAANSAASGFPIFHYVFIYNPQKRLVTLQKKAATNFFPLTIHEHN